MEMRMKSFVAACWCMLACGLPAVAQDARHRRYLDGECHVSGGDPIPPSTLMLKEEGAKIVGAFSGQQGDMPVEASVEGKRRHDLVYRPGPRADRCDHHEGDGRRKTR